MSSNMDYSGLDSLMSEGGIDNAVAHREIERDKISPDPDQPRKGMSQSSLEELALSIKSAGILQPISVRPDPENQGRYIINYGERRWTAAGIAGLEKIPAIIQDGSTPADQLLENLQREDLSALDTADAVKRLLETKKVKAAELARHLGKGRDWVSLYKKLAETPDDLRDLYRNGVLADGRAVVELERARSKYPGPVQRYIDSLVGLEEPQTRRDMRNALDRIEHNAQRLADEEAAANAADEKNRAENETVETKSSTTGHGSNDEKADKESPAEHSQAPKEASTAKRPNETQHDDGPEKPTDNATAQRPQFDQSTDRSSAAERKYDGAGLMPRVRVTWTAEDGKKSGIIVGAVENSSFSAAVKTDDGEVYEVTFALLRISAVKSD